MKFVQLFDINIKLRSFFSDDGFLLTLKSPAKICLPKIKGHQKISQIANFKIKKGLLTNSTYIPLSRTQTFVAAVCQHSIRQEISMARIGTLPAYLYQREIKPGKTVSSWMIVNVDMKKARQTCYKLLVFSRDKKKGFQKVLCVILCTCEAQ